MCLRITSSCLKNPLNCSNAEEECAGSRGLARAGDLCLDLWEASDLCCQAC